MSAQARILPRRAAALAALAFLLSACAAAPASKPPTLPNFSAAQCLGDLDRRGVDYRPAATPVGTGACAVENPVEISRASLPLNQPVLMTCALADELDRFLSEAAAPLAEKYLGRRLVRIDHMGAYSCRHETGQAGRWSEHAGGRAIDVSAFVLAGGGRVEVERDWYRAGKERDFLHALAKRACDYFNVVLTPDTDRYHYNHLHLDIGRYRLCSV